MRKTLATLVATVALVAAPTAAFAGDGGDNAPKPLPLKDGWHWILPDGQTVGAGPADGYHNVCSVVPNHENRKYWGAYAPESGWKPAYDVSWTRINELREQFYKGNASLWGVQGLKEEPENVIDCADVKPGMLVEVDHVRNDVTIPPGGTNDGTDNSLEPCTKEETRTEQVLVKPAVPGTPGTPGTPEIPGKPAVTRSERYVKTPARAAVKESNPVIGTFQVDTYRPKTAAQAKVVARLDDDGMLTYREDKALWGASTYEFVTVTAKDVKSTGSLAKAIDAKTRKVGNISAGPVMSARAGGTYSMAWKLGKGATVKQAWGARNKTPQIAQYGLTELPAYRAAVKASPAVYGTRTVVVTPATPAVPAVPGTPGTPAQDAVYETRTYTVTVPAMCHVPVIPS